MIASAPTYSRQASERFITEPTPGLPVSVSAFVAGEERFVAYVAWQEVLPQARYASGAFTAAPYQAVTSEGELSLLLIRRLVEQTSLAVSEGFGWWTTGFSSPAAPLPRNARAIHLLREWMAEGPVCDDETWVAFKETIEESRLSYRKRFSD